MIARQCPTCGVAVERSVAGHAVASHGLVRPPTVLAVCAALVLAGGLCIYECLDLLSPLFRLLGESDALGFAGLLLVVVLTFGAYGAALCYIDYLLWTADRVSRLLAFAAGGPVAAACLLGNAHSGVVTTIGLVALGVIAALAFVPEVAAWLTGPYSANPDEPAAVVAARALLGWTGFLAGIASLGYLLITTDDGAKVVPFLAYGTGAALLVTAVSALRTGDPAVRVRASAGIALVALASLLTEELASVGTLAVVGPAVAAAVLLWTNPEAVAHFGGTGVSLSSLTGTGDGFEDDHGLDPRPLPAMPDSAGWGPPTGPAAGWTAPPAGSGWPDATGIGPGAGTAGPEGGIGPPGPHSGWPLPDVPTPSGLAALPPPAPETRLDLPLDDELAVAPLPVADASAATTLVGFTHLAANRVVLVLLAAGARLDDTDISVARLAVGGAEISVLASDSTRVLVEGVDVDRLRRVQAVAEATIRAEDPGFELRASAARPPAPAPMPGAVAREGWYPDPFEAVGARYWDGQRWTARRGRPSRR